MLQPFDIYELENDLKQLDVATLAPLLNLKHPDQILKFTEQVAS